LPCANAYPCEAATRNPLDRFFIVLRNTPSFEVHHTEIILRLCISLFSREPIPLDGVFEWTRKHNTATHGKGEHRRHQSAKNEHTHFAATRQEAIVHTQVASPTAPRRQENVTLGTTANELNKRLTIIEKALRTPTCKTGSEPTLQRLSADITAGRINEHGLHILPD
jgi:hypothetical protein